MAGSARVPTRSPLRQLVSSDGVSEVLAADAARSLVVAAEEAGSQYNMTALVVDVLV